MNILPKKSWHVYNEKNRLKVKEDEAKALKKEEIFSAKKQQAENEFRLEILRKRARPAGATEEDLSDKRQKHFNLWEGLDTLKGEGNAEYAKEKQKEVAKYEKFFRQPLVTKEPKPWYAETSLPQKEESYSANRRKLREDPLTTIQKTLAIRHPPPPPSFSSSSPAATGATGAATTTTTTDYTKDLQKLRQQRLERERIERERERRLLGLSSASQSTEYHSQYNPSLTRKAHHQQHHQFR